MIRYAIGFILAGALLLANDFFFFESVLVPSSSMEPTLLPNERLFLKKVGVGPWQRFDVVVFKKAEARKRLVKRIIGLPGECIEIREGWKVRIQGKDWDYSPVPGSQTEMTEAGAHGIQLAKSAAAEDEKPGAPPVAGVSEAFCLKEGEYFLLGDNRLASHDSRWIGPVLTEEIQGRVVALWYSYDRKAKRLRSERLGLSRF